MKMNSKAPFILYGGDYNPDQWDDEIIEKDMEYFRKAGVNLVTLPVFSWAKLEPEEGRYEFEWLDKIMGTLLKNHINVFLSTPTVANRHGSQKNIRKYCRQIFREGRERMG